MREEIYPLEFLYDGSCPICSADVAKLRKADRQKKLIFIDITSDNFDPGDYGRSLDELLARIHARRADGKLVEGAEVFRLSLTAVGLGWIAAPTRWPHFNYVTELAYDWFARNRSVLSQYLGRLYTPAIVCDSRCQSQRDEGVDKVRSALTDK
jgi:predicted DCC family thiol-disulfide oxidoreductase YuxK